MDNKHIDQELVKVLVIPLFNGLFPTFLSKRGFLTITDSLMMRSDETEAVGIFSLFRQKRCFFQAFLF